MLAILLFVAYPGFICVPPVELNNLVRSPYQGPFVMSLEKAQALKATSSQLWLQLVRGDDPQFESIKARCPPIFFPGSAT
jgi:hypothetical protein